MSRATMNVDAARKRTSVRRLWPSITTRWSPDGSSCLARRDQSRRGGVMNSSQAERLQWIALTVLGLVAGLALALPLGVPIFAIAGAMVGTPIVLSIVGLSLGTAHGPIIRRHLSSSWWWVCV